MTDQPGRRFGAVDVHYPGDGSARAALVVADDIRLSHVREEHWAWQATVEPYQPGRFYLRELPPITAVLATTERLDLLVIDGYVDLDPAGTPGLGAHLHTHTGLPIIGIAKTAFRTATHAIAIHRGRAARPLYVTAAGFPADQAAALVTAMAGSHRIPDALRWVDTLARRGPTQLIGHRLCRCRGLCASFCFSVPARHLSVAGGQIGAFGLDPPPRRRILRWSSVQTEDPSFPLVRAVHPAGGGADTPRAGCSAEAAPSVLVKRRTSEHHRSTVRSRSRRSHPYPRPGGGVGPGYDALLNRFADLRDRRFRAV